MEVDDAKLLPIRALHVADSPRMAIVAPCPVLREKDPLAVSMRIAQRLIAVRGKREDGGTDAMLLLARRGMAAMPATQCFGADMLALFIAHSGNFDA